MNVETQAVQPLTIHLYSFGFKFGPPPADPSGHNGGFVFDCRALPNPFWDETLRPYHGLEPEIAAFMEAQPAVQAFAEHAGWLVRNAAQVYAADGRERLMVSFGCTGGRHRSVYQAQRLADALRGEGYRVMVEHLHLHADDAAFGR